MHQIFHQLLPGEQRLHLFQVLIKTIVLGEVEFFGQGSISRQGSIFRRVARDGVFAILPRLLDYLEKH